MIVDQRVCKTTLTSVKDFKGKKKRDVIWAVFEDAFSNSLQLTGPDDYACPGAGATRAFPSVYEVALDVFGQVYPAANPEHQFRRRLPASFDRKGEGRGVSVGPMLMAALKANGVHPQLVTGGSWGQWAGYPPVPGCCSGVVGARLGGASSVEQKASAASSANPMTSARKKRYCCLICFHRLGTIRCASFRPDHNGTHLNGSKSANMSNRPVLV